MGVEWRRRELERADASSSVRAFWDSRRRVLLRLPCRTFMPLFSGRMTAGNNASNDS